MVPALHRTLKRAIDLQAMRTITSDDLLAMHPDDYQDVRRQATRARSSGVVRYACESCGHAVYAPRSPRTGLPLWRHHAGAPVHCPWWTGDPDAIDRVSARQFDGIQESPLHAHLKTLIGNLLEADPRTLPGSIAVDRYVLSDNGRRRPDVLAVHEGVRTVFEVQLATTQIPIILGREDFYETEDIRLLWVTWNFEPPARGGRLQSSIEDIFYSHGKCLFSMDAQTIELSKSRGTLMLRAFRNDAGWSSRVLALHELTWLPGGRATMSPRTPLWNERFLAQWRAKTTESGMAYEDRIELLATMVKHLRAPDVTVRSLEDEDVEDLINCLLSISDGRPIASRQKNLHELLNTFLMVPRRQRLAQLITAFCSNLDRSELLTVPSVGSKIAIAMKGQQDTRRSVAGLVALALFPEVFRRSTDRRGSLGD